jgi:hypothetical protein
MPCGMLEVATTLQLRPPRLSEVGALLQTVGGEATNGAVAPAQKSPPLPPRFPFISEPWQWHVQISQLLRQ